jgi:hypothetical protein
LASGTKLKHLDATILVKGISMTPSKAEVIVWLRKTGSFPALRRELLGLAGDEPNESTDYEGMVDFHWSFSHLADAERMASALTPLTSWPELVLLRLSNYDNLDRSVTYKDERVRRQGST